MGDVSDIKQVEIAAIVLANDKEHICDICDFKRIKDFGDYGYVP